MSTLLYFTDVQDTPASVAAKFSGGNNADLAKKIRLANANTLAGKMQSSDYYSPNSPIVIPIYWDQSKDNSNFQERVLTRVNHFLPSSRANLAKAQRQGHDLNHLGHTHQAVKKANKETKDSSVGLVIGGAAGHAADAYVDIKQDRLSEFDEALKSIKGHLFSMAKSADQTALNTARKAYFEAREELNQKYISELEQFDLKGSALLRRPARAVKRLNANGWEIFDEQILDNVEGASRCLKFVSGIGLVVDAAFGVDETYDAYKQGKDWLKTATTEFADIATYVDVGLTIGIFLTPVGWGALITAAGVSVVGYGINKYIVNPYINRYLS